MPRRRERFDRSDVPRESPYRNVIGAVVCMAALAAVAAVVLFVYGRVQLESHLDDRDLSEALSSQSAQDPTQGNGYAASTDAFENVLLYVASGLDEGGSQLVSARVLSLNTTQGTAAIAGIPAIAKIDFENPAALGDVYLSSGPAATVELLSDETGIVFDHVIVSTADVLGQLSALAAEGVVDPVSQAKELVSQIMTDLEASELVSLAGQVLSSGAAGIVAGEAPLVPETVAGADGAAVETGSQLVDATQLSLALGLLVPAV